MFLIYFFLSNVHTFYGLDLRMFVVLHMFVFAATGI